MGIDREIVSHLVRYGNTRESDLTTFGVQKFHYSSEAMKKVINRMVIKGMIHRIVHNKLKPPEVYISLEETLFPGVLSILDKLGISKAKDNDGVDRILEEAAAVAETKTQEESP